MTNYKNIQPEIRITIIYLVIGFMWILFSGNIVYGFTAESEVIVTLERFKGWFFVIVTGGLLFLLIRRESRKQNNLLGQLSNSREDLLNKSKLLEKQNKQLNEFAFIYSHNLRKPLANILGLIQLIDNEKNFDSENKSVIEKISEQAEELDTLVRKSGTFLKTDTVGENE